MIRLTGISLIETLLSAGLNWAAFCITGRCEPLVCVSAMLK